MTDMKVETVPDQASTTETEPTVLEYIPPEVLGPFMEMTMRACLIGIAAGEQRPTYDDRDNLQAEAEQRAKMADGVLSLLESGEAEAFAVAMGWPDAATLWRFVHVGRASGTTH